MVIEIDMTNNFPFKDNSHARCKKNAGKFLITTSYVATAVKFRVIKGLRHPNNFGTRRDRNPL